MTPYKQNIFWSTRNGKRLRLTLNVRWSSAGNEHAAQVTPTTLVLLSLYKAQLYHYVQLVYILAMTSKPYEHEQTEFYGAEEMIKFER